MLCFMCYEPLNDMALRSLVGDVYVYICDECFHDLNLEHVEDAQEAHTPVHEESSPPCMYTDM